MNEESSFLFILFSVSIMVLYCISIVGILKILTGEELKKLKKKNDKIE